MTQKEFNEYVKIIERNDLQTAMRLWNNKFINIKTDNLKLTILHVAVRCRSDLELIEFILSKGVEVNERDRYGDSPLHLAVRFINDKITSVLIEHGADVNLRDNDGWSPLHRAVRNSNDKVTSILLEHGANVNLCDNFGSSPLHFAADNSNDKVTSLLIEHGATINLCNNNKWSPLHHAAFNNNDKVAGILIEHGADVNLCDYDGSSPLHLAARNSNDKVTSILIEHGANVNLCDNNGMTPLDLAKSYKCQKCVSILKESLHKTDIVRNIVQTDNVEEFKKRYAINGLKLNREIVKLIGQRKPNKIMEYIVSSPITEEEMTVPEMWQGEPLMHEINLYRAIRLTQCKMFEDSVSIELINKNLLLDTKCALQLAIDSQSEIMINEVIKLLKNDNNNILGTILNIYEGRNNKFLNILRKRKCALDGFIKRGYSRLDIAVMDCSRRMLLYLLEKEDDAKVITQALSIAIQHNCEECIRILSARNVEYSYVNKLGQTLLHSAIESGNTAVCHSLVNKCTNLTKKDYFGFTALQRAVTYNEEGVIEQIINKDKSWNTTLYITKPKEVTCFESSANSDIELQKIYQKQLHTIYDKLTEKETTLSLHVKVNNVISETISKHISECDIEFLDGSRNSMLHTAVSNCNLEMCKMIVSISKRTLFMKNNENISPLRLAVQMAKDGINDKVKLLLNIIQYLISVGAQLEQDEFETKSILQEAITTKNEELLILLVKESEEPITVMTENEFKFIRENQLYNLLRHVARNLHKDLVFKLVTKNVIVDLFTVEQYSSLMSLFPYLNGEVRKAVINEYLYIAYKWRNEELFTKLCNMNEFEMKLLDNDESIMTYIIKDDNKTYILHLLEATYVKLLVNTPNNFKELPIHLILKKKWFNMVYSVLRETEIVVDEENAEGDTAISILIKQLVNNIDDIEQTNEILNLIFTFIDNNHDIYRVSSISGRSPISFGGKYRFKIERYCEKRGKAKEKDYPAGAIGGGVTEADKVSKICYICRDREINCVLDCGHTFCTECVDRVDSCPNCRERIDSPRKMYF